MPASRLMKPFQALASPGLYLYSKFNEYKREQDEEQKRKVTEKELEHLHQKIDRLLIRLEETDGPTLPRASTVDEECVICLQAKATMQTQPCGHRVVCRRCFVKTIQAAISQRCLPLRCVVCRTKILKLKSTKTSRAPALLQAITSKQTMNKIYPSK